LIDFREDTKSDQEVKEKVLAKKWTYISIEGTNEKLKCVCDACSFQKLYACQQPLINRHQQVENPFFLKFRKLKIFKVCFQGKKSFYLILMLIEFRENIV
jgi:hypothetical protein